MHVSNWQVTLIIPKKPVCPRALHCASDIRVRNGFLKKKRVRSRALHCASDIRVRNGFFKKKRVRSRAIHCASDIRVRNGFCLCDVIIEKWYYIIAPKFYEQQQYLYESVVLTPVHPRICVHFESFQ